MLMCIDIMAQYECNKNYKLFEDDFDVPGRTWNASYMDSENKWVAYFQGSGITHGTKEHQAYQRSQAVFDDNNEMMLLVADYVSEVDLTCNDLEKPVGGWCNITDEHHIRYISGALESIDKSFLYGYFEMRCKLPVHKSAFPAFWLWSSCKANAPDCNDPHYEEIDIFEYSWTFTDSVETPNTEALYLGDNRYFTAGLYINDTGISGDNIWQYGAARISPRIPENKPSLDQWNTWGCLWMPDKVEWYLNGDQQRTLPCISVKVTLVLLNVASTYAIPDWINRPVFARLFSRAAVSTAAGASAALVFTCSSAMIIISLIIELCFSVKRFFQR